MSAPVVSLRRLATPLVSSPFDEPAVPPELEATLAAVCDDAVDTAALVRGRTVYVKPNLNFVAGASSPFAPTDPRVIVALCAVLRRHGAARIVLGEKPGQGRGSAAAYALLRRFALPQSVACLDLDAEPRVTVASRTRLVAPALALPRPYLEADVVIDLAKLKTHTLTAVSLGMKNLFGLLRDEEKMRHHNEDIHPKLVDLLSVRRPDLTILDGLVGLEGQGPLFGTGKPLGLLIASADCVAADAAAAHVMGFEAAEIPHLRLAAEHGLGELRQGVMIFPALRPAAVRAPFTRGDLWANPVPTVEVVWGQGVPLGYANGVSHSLERLAVEGRRPAPTRVYVGRCEARPAGPAVIVFGDVTARSLAVDGARVIPGHPPRAFELYRVLADDGAAAAPWKELP
ncbi:MAG TPA: DUF362 domain-containing protein [Polyangia bacterium]